MPPLLPYMVPGGSYVYSSQMPPLYSARPQTPFAQPPAPRGSGVVCAYPVTWQRNWQGPGAAPRHPLVDPSAVKPSIHEVCIEQVRR